MQHLSTKADYHCSPKAEWRSCSTTLKNLWIPSRVVISYKLLLSCTFCHTKQINMRLAYILSFYICQLSMAIKRSRRRENKAMAKDRPWTPWITPRPEHLLEEGKAGFLVLNFGSSWIVLRPLAAPALCEDQNDAALNQGLARLGKVGHACISSAASTH